MSAPTWQRIQLKRLALQLSPGESRSGLLCPQCEGGETGERSFSITRRENADVALYHCHRAKCGLKGGLSLIQLTGMETANSHKGHPSDFLQETPFKIPETELVHLEGDLLNSVLKKYNLTEGEIRRGGWKWDAKSDRLYMPMLGLYSEIGFVLRSFDPTVRPKAMAFRRSNWCQKYCMYRTPGRINSSKLLIVEDQPSALRASYKIDSLALLGVHLGEELVARLKGAEYTDVIMCLDADAFVRGLNLQKKYQSLFNSFPIVKPEKDLKNMDRNELDKFLNDIIGKTTSS